MNDKKYVVEWSHSHQDFHVELLSKILDNNLEKAVKNQPSDFIPVALAESFLDGTKIADDIRRLRAENYFE